MRQYAIRKVKKKVFDSRQQRGFQTHIEELYRARHPNVIALVHHFEDRKYLYLVFEYADGPDLRTQLLSTQRTLQEQDVLDIVLTIGNTLRFLHEQKIVYRALALQRILVLDERIKLAEIGLDDKLKAKLAKSKSTRNVFSHQPPEVFLGSEVTPAIDVWHLGVVFHQLLSGKSPFQIDDINAHVKSEKDRYQLIQSNILKDAFHLERSISKPLRELLKRMLHHSPGSRIAVGDLVSHPVFTGSLSRHSLDSPSPLLLSNQFTFPLEHTNN